MFREFVVIAFMCSFGACKEEQGIKVKDLNFILGSELERQFPDSSGEFYQHVLGDNSSDLCLKYDIDTHFFFANDSNNTEPQEFVAFTSENVLIGLKLDFRLNRIALGLFEENNYSFIDRTIYTIIEVENEKVGMANLYIIKNEFMNQIMSTDYYGNMNY